MRACSYYRFVVERFVFKYRSILVRYIHDFEIAVVNMMICAIFEGWHFWNG
jgi:hypothetical protein